MNPRRPTIPFRSPPARRSTMRSGHPRNTRAPTIMKNPSTKRSTGLEPPRGRNSPFAIEMPMAPKTRPMISGRRYCTTGAECNLRAPAVSRTKHAMQNPMFLGFPKATNNTAMMPTTEPATSRFRLSFVISIATMMIPLYNTKYKENLIKYFYFAVKK